MKVMRTKDKTGWSVRLPNVSFALRKAAIRAAKAENRQVGTYIVNLIKTDVATNKPKKSE